MARIIAQCAILYAVAIIAESRSFSLVDETVGNNDVYNLETRRIKRVAPECTAPDDVDSTASLLTNILNTALQRIREVKRSRSGPEEAVTVSPRVIKPHRVLINGPGWDLMCRTARDQTVASNLPTKNKFKTKVTFVPNE